MTPDIWTNTLAFGAVLPPNQFYEVRLENDSSGNVLYMGMCLTPNGSTSENIWYIVKMGYDVNTFIDRVQKPDGGLQFAYAWDSRASYFS